MAATPQTRLEMTRLALAEWARHVRGIRRTGYPTSAAFVHAGEGARAISDTDLPPHVMVIDGVVCRAPATHRLMIFAGYIYTGRWAERAARVGLTRWQLTRRVLRAENYVDQMLAEGRTSC